MAVPAHDERDFAFAEKFGLPIRRVVARARRGGRGARGRVHRPRRRRACSSTAAGTPACRPTRAAGGSSRTSRRRGEGRAAVTYRLRDWLISRQRYWGTPIPVIHCPTHGIVPVPDEDLPVLLPDKVDYAGSGVNPLTRDEAFLNVPCPIDGEPAQRETDTMDTFIDSAWYWYRYLSPQEAGRADRRRPGRGVDAGRAVHRRRRARRHAPALRPRVHEDDARHRAGPAERALEAGLQPGPDPGHGRRADVEVAGQHPGPRRARREATAPTRSGCS